MLSNTMKMMMAGGKIAALTALMGTTALAHDATRIETEDGNTAIVPGAAADAESSVGAVTESPYPLVVQVENDQVVAETLIAQFTQCLEQNIVAAPQQAEPTTAPFANSESEAAGQQPLAAATAPESATPAAELTPVQDPVSDGSGAALLFALLAVGGVGLAAFLLFRSRRRKRDEEVPVIEQPVVAEPLSRDTGTVGTTYNSEPAPAMRAEPITPMTSNKDVAVELPSEAPRNPAERDRLLKRMIDAKPDRANPFASHKARAKRARLILQSLGTRFTDRKPGIDLSQYSNVWPELRGWRPATT